MKIHNVLFVVDNENCLTYHDYWLSESFELLLKFGKSSFLRIPDRGPGQAQESSHFKTFWIPAYAGMTKWGCFAKVFKLRVLLRYAQTRRVRTNRFLRHSFFPLHRGSGALIS